MSTTNATLGQGAHILTLIGQKNISKDRLTALVESGLLSDLLDIDPSAVNRDEFRKVLDLGPLELTISVDYGQTLEKMIAAGRYDWKNDDITAKNFPVKGEGKVERKAKIIHFDRDISSENALKELDKMGLRAGTIEELLAFGDTFPEMQRKFPIVALGSVAKVRGCRRVAYLDGGGSERSLDLGRFGYDWDAGCRFLAFEK